MPTLAEMLSDGLSALNLIIPTAAQEKLLEYLQQLHKWNQAYNLSGIKNPQEMLTLHILDSLTLAPHIDAELIADVGTGAGLPGLPLAVCYPDCKFTLIDSNSKKTRFIFQMTALLKLHNVQVIHSRVQDYECLPQVGIVTSRAFSSLTDFITNCQHLLEEKGKFLAMKGHIPEAEVAALPAGFTLIGSHPLAVPGTDVKRHVLDIRRT